MKLPKKFEEYIKTGVVKKVSPDISRAKFLIQETGTTLEGLKERVDKIGINEKNANSIVKDCYDIILELIRAKLLLDGYNSSGQHSHEAEVSYLQNLKFSDNEVAFLNELRYFRNSVTYYGKILDKFYAEKVFHFMNKIIARLYDLFG